MRLRAIAIAMSAAVAIGVTAMPAEAASNSVTIKKIAGKTAPYKKSVKISPRVSKTGQVKIDSKTLTVKKGKKIVRKNKKSTTLSAGKYTLVQKVKYRTFVNKKKNVVVVNAGDRLLSEYAGDPFGSAPFVGDCAMTRVDSDVLNFDATCDVARFNEATYDNVALGKVQVTGTYTNDDGNYSYQLDGGVASLDFQVEPQVGGQFSPDEVIAGSNVYKATTVRSYSKSKTKTRSQKLTIKKGKKGRTCAKKADFNKVKNGQSKSTVARIMHGNGKQYFYSSGIEGREYKACSSSSYMAVSFEDGYVYDKMFVDF